MTPPLLTLEASGPDFSLAFQQMASFVAIAKTREPNETLDELVKQCFVILPDEPFSTAGDVVQAVQALFGIQLSSDEVGNSLARLIAAGEVIQLPGQQLSLTQEVHNLLYSRIEYARKLEVETKQSWLTQVGHAYPNLAPDKLWKVLLSYLRATFRRHGIQAVALLNPTAEVAQLRMETLSPILRTAVKEQFSNDDVPDARSAVALFFSSIGSDRKRAEYVALLADSAFNYFSLMIDPEVSSKLRSTLTPMTLFLDTNFLFGLLELHVNTQVDVSQELITAVTKYNLPFKLRYHEATEREMNNTLVYYTSDLRTRSWPQALSRAAVNSGRLSGIELRYHISNSQQPIDVDEYLSPFRYWDAILNQRNINIYKISKLDNRLQSRADLEADYMVYLKRINRDKPQEAIQHDMAVLDTVRQLRGSARSSLEAGALLVTCDKILYRFDVESSRRLQINTTTVLPSLFWQLLRPFIPHGGDFDKAFAETFALPEFSLSRGGATKAASKLLGILSGYENIPEETAFRMLTNDILFDRLQAKGSEAEYQQAVEAEILRFNEELIEENAALSTEAALANDNLESKTREVLEIQSSLADTTRDLELKTQALEQKDADLRSLESDREHAETEMRRIREQAEREQKAREEAESKVRQLEQQKQRYQTMFTVAGALGAILLTEWLVHVVFHWDWLLNHPNSYGLQASISVAIFTFILGIGIKRLRNVLWATCAFGALAVALGLLGGPPATP